MRDMERYVLWAAIVSLMYQCVMLSSRLNTLQHSFESFLPTQLSINKLKFELSSDDLPEPPTSPAETTFRPIQLASDNLPSCLHLKHTVHGMGDGAFITREPGDWFVRADGSKEYRLRTCRLERFDAHAARQCMSKHHKLLLGDSLMRYQYLSLVYLLEHGKFPPRWGTATKNPGRKCLYTNADGSPACSPAEQPHVCMENDWATKYGHAVDKSWKQYHMALGGAAMNGHLECQTARINMTHSVEAMFYERGSIKVTYFMPMFGVGGKVDKYPSQMHWWQRSGCAATGSCNMSSADWEQMRAQADHGEYDFDGSLMDLLATNGTAASARMRAELSSVDIAVWNQGQWGGMGTEDFYAEVFDGLFALVAPNNGRCFYKGCSPNKGNGLFDKQDPNHTPREEEKAYAEAYKSGCGVFDTYHVTQAFRKFRWFGWRGGRHGRKNFRGH